MSGFLDDLNRAVADVSALPRVRFDIGLGDDAEKWIRKKHAGGAVHEPATLGAFLAVSRNFNFHSIFDVGALYGYFSLFAMMAFDEAEITAFEMHPGAFGPLSLNVGPSVNCVRAAISDVDRPNTPIWISGFNIYEEPAGGWQRLGDEPDAMKERGANNRGRGFAKVDFITLDTYCTHNKAPDLIKIDVEAYQAKAILGGLETFRKHRPVIIIELHDLEKIQRMGTTNKDTLHPLLQLGYNAFWCENFRSPDARYEPVTEMGLEHERLSMWVLVP